jgi:O-Antigen ligase
MRPLTSNAGLRERIQFGQSRLPRVGRNSQSNTTHPTTLFERALVMLTIAALPLQDEIPSIAGFSIMFLLFVFIGAYVAVFRPLSLIRISAHPVFLTAFGFVVLSTVIETFHPGARYSEIFRMTQTLSGAVFLACLCRDRKALRAGIYGYVLMALCISVYLALTSYGVLAGASASNFEEATRVRMEIDSDSSMQADPNTLGFFAAQGTVVSLAMALATKSFRRRVFFYGTCLICGVATFLPMSRGAIAILILCCASVLYATGFKRVKALTAVAAMTFVVGILVPDAVFARLVLRVESSGGLMEARTRVYTAGIQYLPEYLWTGVGFGNFWGPWGISTDFSTNGRAVTGPHNSFIAVTIYWGLAGLLTMLFLMFQAYRCIPKRSAQDPLALCLLGIAVSIALFLMVMHVLSAKQFALGLGLLVGARCWIWPQMGGHRRNVSIIRS